MKGDLITEWKITPNWLCKYHYVEGEKPSNLRPQANKVKGELSRKSMARLRGVINWICYLAKPKRVFMKEDKRSFYFKINFITVTLASKQVHSDREIKKQLLQPLLRIMRDRWKIVNYVWKAETQENGNIHFHILADKFIHWRELRDTWNTIQETLQYVSRSKLSDPNSTDIHAVRNIRNIGGYMVKYLCKNQSDRRKVEGKLWDCNTELKKIIVKSREEKMMELEEEQIIQEGGKAISTGHIHLTVMKEGQLNNLYLSPQEVSKKLNEIYGQQEEDNPTTRRKEGK